MVARSADVGAARFEGEALPLLVVEVLSPSSRLIDPTTKRVAYREGGIGANLIADPQRPSVRFIQWDEDDEFERFAAGEQVSTIDWPVHTEGRPADLVVARR